MSTHKTNFKLQHQATSAFTIASLLTIGLLPFSPTVIAQSAPAGTVINNFSTATYEDPLNQTTVPIVSNNVILTIAEIAGVTVVGTGIDANPNINPGDIIYFNFTINNVGNDPTQFFIPSLPKSVTGVGTFNAATIGSIEIVETKDASGVVISLPGGVAKINVPATGGITSPSVQAGGTVRIRVPIQVAAGVTTGSTITVVMGDAAATDSSNQVYVAGTNKDLYTIDNKITPLPAGEISDVPTNGTRESSASQDAIINPTVIPTDFGELPSSYKTTFVDNGARHSIVPGVYLGAGITSETDGSPVISPANITTTDNNGVIFDPVYGQQILRASTVGDTLNTIKITASTAGYINAWIDLNGNGTFDPADRVLTEVAVIAGDNNINITLPNTVINGNTYARFRFTTGINQATLSTGLAPNGEVEDYQIQIVKSGSVPTTTSLCTERGGTTTTDNLIFGGNFPTIGTVATNIAGATSDYTYDFDPTWSNGWPNNNSTTPIDGRYLVTSGTGPNTYNNGAWYDLSEHTGDGGGMMIVNGNSSSKVIEATIGNLTIGKTYEFSTWVANLATAAGGSSLPDLKLEYSTDGNTWNLVTNSGSIAKTTNPEWNIYGNFFTATATSVRVRISNNQTGSAGNDFAIDDLRLSGCDVPLVSGRVFEDINYGGGDGRNYITAKNNSPIIPVEVQNAIVELYQQQSDNSFKKVAQRNTIGDGSYQFTTADGASYNGIYRVRVINNTVKSNRPGSTSTLIPVQTFRKDPSAAIPEIINQVGGLNPQLIDATLTQATGADFTALASTTTVAQSSTPATMNNTEVKNLDFGFNFDTIVNTNDGGQGSLRQFIDNSNALTNANLNQAANSIFDPAPGIETSIFMIPSSRLTAGVAIINVIAPSLLPSITDNATSIDGRTQTANIGDTNTTILNSTSPATVGSGGLTLNRLNGPEVQIQNPTGGTGTFAHGLKLEGTDATVRGISILKFGGGNVTVTGGTATGTLLTAANILIATTALRSNITENAIGTTATSFTDPGIGTRSNGYGIATATTNATITNNLIGYHAWGGVEITNATADVTLTGNEIRGNAIDAFAADGTNIISGGGMKVEGNLFADNWGPGIDMSGSSGSSLYRNNTVTNNGRGAGGQTVSQTSGLRIRGDNNAIDRNIIFDNYGAGILVRDTVSNTLITQNSIYGNGTTGVAIGQIGIDLVATSGDNNQGSSNFVTPNDQNDLDTGGNELLNFPVLTTASMASNQLVVTGFAPTGAKIELFVSDPGPNPPATSFTKIFGEGKTYLTTVTEGAAGVDLDTTTGNYTDDGTNATVAKTGVSKFEFRIPLGTGNTLNGQTITNTTKLTATATTLTGSSTIVGGVSYPTGATSEFSGLTTVTTPVTTNPNVLLVKRITRINNQDFTTYQQEDTNPYDDNELEPLLAVLPTYPTPDTNKWPETINKTSSTFLVGKVNGGSVKPNDSIEYTIYFLSTGDGAAKNVRFCDRIPDNVTFIPNSFNSVAANPNGLSTADRGVVVSLGNTLRSYTNINDGDDAQYFPPNVEPSTVYPNINCGKDLSGQVLLNTNGAVVVNLKDRPNATGTAADDDANGAYGFVRFRGQVK